MDPQSTAAPRRHGVIKSPVEFAGGLLLLAIAGVGYLGAAGLDFGQISGIGPGLLPKIVSCLVASFGVLLVAAGLTAPGDALERWHLRGPVFVLGAVLLFALTIRGSTLSLAGITVVIPQMGLAIAGPAAVVVASLADRDTRLVEIVPFAFVLTALSIGLFKFVLRLPMPVFPSGIGPF